MNVTAMVHKEKRPLSEVKQGEKVRLTGVDAGHGLNSRLAALGIVPGTEITIVKKGSHGPFVVKVKGSKMALGRGIAHRIFVK